MTGQHPQRCPFCFAENSPGRLVREKTGYRIYRCPTCTVRYVYPQPTPAELEAIYSAEYFERGNKYVLASPGGVDPNRLNEENKLRHITAIKPRGRLLDVGCATGGFLAVAHEAGFDVQGVEISGDASARTREQFGVDVFTGVLADARFPDEQFDVVTMWDVIEHVSDPRAHFIEANRILKPGGVLALSTGDIGSLWARVSGPYWQLLTPPQHLFYFTQPSLESMLKQTGYDRRGVAYSSKVVTLEFLGFKMREAFGPLISPIRILTSARMIRNRQVSINLHDIITLLAVKKAG